MLERHTTACYVEFFLYLIFALAVSAPHCLYKALCFLEEHTFVAHNKEEFAENFKETKGFVKATWCGDRECEDKIKEEFNGILKLSLCIWYPRSVW